MLTEICGAPVLWLARSHSAPGRMARTIVPARERAPHFLLTIPVRCRWFETVRPRLFIRYAGEESDGHSSANGTRPREGSKHLQHRLGSTFDHCWSRAPAWRMCCVWNICRFGKGDLKSRTPRPSMDSRCYIAVRMRLWRMSLGGELARGKSRATFPVVLARDGRVERTARPHVALDISARPSASCRVMAVQPRAQIRRSGIVSANGDRTRRRSFLHGPCPPRQTSLGPPARGCARREYPSPYRKQCFPRAWAAKPATSPCRL